jgi:ribosomal protein S13
MSYNTKIKEVFIEELVEIAYYKGINEQRKTEILKKAKISKEEEKQIKEFENEINKLNKIISNLKNEIIKEIKKGD